ncbi:MAG: esterase family protein [Ktedonobacterales bacterium]
MRREYSSWFSPSLGREMQLLTFGQAGARVIAFPTSMGRFYQWEDFGMVDALRHHLDEGWIQLFCVDSVDEESWYARWRPPAERALRQTQYDAYLLNEVVPFTAAQNSNAFLIATGASFGAYQAINFAFRHPALVDRVIGMSGLYDIGHFTDGYSDDNVYFNDPAAYIAHEHDDERLVALRHQDIILATGHDDPNCSSNEQLSATLWRDDIWHALRIWDGWAHDWPWWRQMIARYIGGHD